jgi:outer membrane protein
LWFFPVLFSFTAVFFLLAQPDPSFARDLRVGAIDIQKAVSGTKEWKREFLSFKTNFNKEKKLITKKEAQLKKMIDNIKKQGMVLNPELKKKKEEEVLKKKREFERYVQDRNEDLAKQEKEITNRILRKMADVINKLGKEKRFTMILEKKVGLYFDNSVDLTALAIQAYNKK